MPDTVRTRADNLALLADNVTGDISPQDVRDSYVTLADISGAVHPIHDHGASTSGDATTEMQAALDDSLSTGRPLFIPPNTFRVTGLVGNVTATWQGLKIIGTGGRSIIEKIDTGTAPLLHLRGRNASNTADLLRSVKGRMQDVYLVGDVAVNHDILRLENLAEFKLDNVHIKNSGGVGVHGLGWLVSTADRLSIDDCATGLRLNNSAAGIWCNNLFLPGLRIRASATNGLHVIRGNDLIIPSSDFALCGTAGNLNTGPIRFESTWTSETGWGHARFDMLRFEGNNKGTGIWARGDYDAAARGNLSIHDAYLGPMTQEAGVGHAITCEALNTLSLKQVSAPGGGSASRLTVTNVNWLVNEITNYFGEEVIT